MQLEVQEKCEQAAGRLGPFLLKSGHRAVVSSELGEAVSKEEHSAGRTLAGMEEAC